MGGDVGRKLGVRFKRERHKEKEILRREKVSTQEAEMLEGTFRVSSLALLRLGIAYCMYREGCAFHLPARCSRELRGQMESPGTVQRLLSTRCGRDVPEGAAGDGRVRLTTLSSL